MIDDPNQVANILTAARPFDVVPVIGVLIPIVAIVMGLGVGMLKLYLDFRKKREMVQLHHAERMAAIEKGIELPSLPSEFFQEYRRPAPSETTYLRRGLLLLLIGIAVTIAMFADNHDHDAWWGLVLVAAGLAYLLTYYIGSRVKPPPGDDPANRKGS